MYHLFPCSALCCAVTQYCKCSYDYVNQVAAYDMYDGLTDAANMFVDYTIARFEEVKQLHIILLVVSLVCIIGFVVKVFRPYVRKLHTESKALAGMMSLLPAEVDIESHVKTVVLGLSKDRVGNSMRSASMTGLNDQPGGGGGMQPWGGSGGGGFGRGPGGSGGGGPPGMMRLMPAPPSGGGGGAGGGAVGSWYGARGGGGGGGGGPGGEYGGGGGGGGWGGGNPRGGGGGPQW